MRVRTQRDYINRKSQLKKEVRVEALQIMQRQRKDRFDQAVEAKAEKKAREKHQRMLRKQKKH